MVHIRSVIYALQDKGIVSANVVIGELTGGTMSKVYRIEDRNKKMILKMNTPACIEQEVRFLNTYKSNPMLPNVIYYDDKYQFYMMSYVPGKMMKRTATKAAVFKQCDIFNDYQLANDRRVGDFDALYSNFHSFLKANLQIEVETIQRYVDLNELYYFEQLDHMPLPNEHPKYVHGDFGYHNFIENDNQIHIIDPTPMQNLILYEMLFLYFSTPYDIHDASFQFVYALYSQYESMSMEAFRFYAELICLLRIATCSRHHVQEMDLYMNVLENLF